MVLGRSPGRDPALGELAGGDAETELAAALVAICLEQFCVVREPLDAPTFAWLLARAPDAVDAALDTDLVIGGGRDELFHHLGRVPGEAGAAGCCG